MIIEYDNRNIIIKLYFCIFELLNLVYIINIFIYFIKN